MRHFPAHQTEAAVLADHQRLRGIRDKRIAKTVAAPLRHILERSLRAGTRAGKDNAIIISEHPPSRYIPVAFLAVVEGDGHIRTGNRMRNRSARGEINYQTAADIGMYLRAVERNAFLVDVAGNPQVLETDIHRRPGISPAGILFHTDDHRTAAGACTETVTAIKSDGKRTHAAAGIGGNRGIADGRLYGIAAAGKAGGGFQQSADIGRYAVILQRKARVIIGLGRCFTNIIRGEDFFLHTGIRQYRQGKKEYDSVQVFHRWNLNLVNRYIKYAGYYSIHKRNNTLYSTAN